MKKFILKIILISILMVLPYSSFAQKQLVKTVYKGTKGLFRTEAKVLTKEGVEAANKSMLKDAFKSGTEEIGKNYVQKASAKQLVRSAVRKNLLKEIEEKELGSLLRYGMVGAKKEIAHTEKSAVKALAEKEAKNFNYSESILKLKNKIVDMASETYLSTKIKRTILYKELENILAKGPIILTEKELSYLLANPRQLRVFIKTYAGDNKKFQDFFIRLAMGDKKQVEKLLDNPVIRDYMKRSIRRSGDGGVHEWLMTKNFKDFLVNPKWGNDGSFFALSLTKLVQKTSNVLFKTGGGHVSTGRKASSASVAFHNGLANVINKCSSKEEVFVAVKRYAKENLSESSYKEFVSIFEDVFKTF